MSALGLLDIILSYQPLSTLSFNVPSARNASPGGLDVRLESADILGHMSSVPLQDADGREPLPICRRHREWLIEYYRGPEPIVLRFFTDAAPVRQRDKAEESQSIRHLRECPKCRPWVPTLVSPEHYKRQARLVRYCCAGMFCAVEEHDSHQTPRFSFSMFRGEDPCWQIDGKNAFASYCPWCGTKLPDAPFIQED